MNRFFKNAKTLVGLLFTFSLIIFGYFGKFEMTYEADSKNMALVLIALIIF